jgi:DNA end-binding protein Ku
LVDLINQKRNGMTPTAKATPKSAGNVISLMDALKRSLANEKQSTPPAAAAKPKKSRKRIDGQREMLLPISGKREAKEEAKAPPRKAEKPARTPARSKKAG